MIRYQTAKPVGHCAEPRRDLRPAIWDVKFETLPQRHGRGSTWCTGPLDKAQRRALKQKDAADAARRLARYPEATAVAGDEIERNRFAQHSRMRPRWKRSSSPAAPDSDKRGWFRHHHGAERAPNCI